MDYASFYFSNSNISNHSLVIDGIDPIKIEADTVNVDNTQFIDLYTNRSVFEGISVISSRFSNHINSWLLHVNSDENIVIIGSQFTSASMKIYPDQNNGGTGSLDISSSSFFGFTDQNALYLDTNR